MMIPLAGPVQWCLQKLESTDEFFIPAHELWKEYGGQPGEAGISFEEFERQLRADKRFYISPGNSQTALENQQKSPDGKDFGSCILVGLAGRKLSGNELNEAIKAKASHMLHALRKAWDARPDDNPEVEKKLLLLMEQASKLCDLMGANRAAPEREEKKRADD